MKDTAILSRISLASLIVGSLAAPVSAARTAAPTIDDAVAAIRAYAPQALKDQGAPGMSVAITNRTHTIAVITVGFADIASGTPVNSHTGFPIASISKGMTAIALLELHDRGLVDLNATVRTYLPSWSIHSEGTPILVHQLLSHSAGIPSDYTSQQYGYPVAALKNAHTLFKPGTAWSYSNDGFATVGAIIEAVSHEPWTEQIEQRVFTPLGMSHSSPVFTNRTLSDNTATGYSFRDEDYVATPPHPALIPYAFHDSVNPAGSVISTPEDMARYIRFFLNGGKDRSGHQLISPKSFSAMTEPDKFSDGKPVRSNHIELQEWPGFYQEYGYGLAVFHTNGDHLVGHTGGNGGYTACFQANLTRGFGVIALSNLFEAPLHPCAIVKYAMDVLRAQSLGKPLPKPPADPPIPPPAIRSSDYVGSYATRSGSSVEVTIDKGKLALHDAGKVYQLVANARDLFWTDDPRFTIFYVAFERNRSNLVDGFTDGSAYYVNRNHTGPTTFAYPAAWDALAGRYETEIFGNSNVMRVVIVKGHLTIDGLHGLTPLANGTFAYGDSIVKFDTPFDGKMQRLWVDGADLYRMELP